MITVSHINKSYGDQVAVKDLSFTVKKGSICGFLGANGAGKTTTLSILTGCLAPDSGSVTIDGVDLFENPRQAKRKIGYLPEIPPLYPDMTPLEHLSFVCEAKQLPKEVWDQQLQKVISATSLHPMLHRLNHHLSKGYKQRVGLAAALLGEPEVLILDEPTVGLDPVQMMEIRNLVKEYGKEHTVLLSSHILSEMDRLCDKVLILSHGRLVAEDTPEALSGELSHRTELDLTVRADKEKVAEVLQRFHDTLQAEYTHCDEKETSFTLRYSSREDWRPHLFFAFAEAKLAILSMNRRQASLEQIFLELNHGESLDKKGETT